MLQNPQFWRRMEDWVDARVRRVARPVRGVLSAVNAAKSALIVQMSGRADETCEDVEVAQHYGFASAPPVGCEVVAVPVGGSSAHLIIVGELARGQRPTDLENGEVALYHPGGARVHLKADGSVEVTTQAGGSVVLDAAGQVKLNGGSVGAARTGDACSPSAGMTAWLSAVSGALATLTGGAFPPPVDATYAISGGSTTVKVGG
ncbi:MAG TPA: phage baseplate assembly protein V [Myxococcota bacterium]|nr:phage baseplate assembly protein V [Myxococcota bacterium]